VGAFAITVSQSFGEEMERLKTQGDEYSLLMMQSLGDRLVEAASEWLHQCVRRELWGYAKDENLSVKQMFKAAYRGIRPAVGYPSLPDQRTIFPLAELLDAEQIGIRLTENGAMYPQSSVCGLYLASPHARYFIVE
jgi:5-methyltetrahydrofolate--homocysteine methyltransferase